MVPVAEVPPVTVFGETTKLVICAGKIVNRVVLIVPLTEALIVIRIEPLTPNVVMVKELVVAPSGMVIVLGIPASVVLAESATVAPPMGAGWWRVIVPLTELPPTIVEGATVTLCRSGA
jgi:hypothetical protein